MQTDTHSRATHSHSHSSVETHSRGGHIVAEISFRWAFFSAGVQDGGEVERWKSRVGLSGPIKPTLIPARAGSALPPSLLPCPISSQSLPTTGRRLDRDPTPHLEGRADPHTHHIMPTPTEPNNVEDGRREDSLLLVPQYIQYL